MSIVELHNIFSHEDRSNHCHRCSLGRCTMMQKKKKKDLMLIMMVGRKNAYLTVNREARTCEWAQPMGTLSAESVIQPFPTEIKKKKATMCSTMRPSSQDSA